MSISKISMRRSQRGYETVGDIPIQVYHREHMSRWSSWRSKSDRSHCCRGPWQERPFGCRGFPCPGAPVAAGKDLSGQFLVRWVGPNDLLSYRPTTELLCECVLGRGSRRDLSDHCEARYPSLCRQHPASFFEFPLGGMRHWTARHRSSCHLGTGACCSVVSPGRES